MPVPRPLPGSLAKLVLASALVTALGLARPSRTQDTSTPPTSTSPEERPEQDKKATAEADEGQPEKPADSSKKKGRTELAGKPFEELLKTNAKKLFGGSKVEINGNHFEVTYSADGNVAAGFEGRDIMDSKHELMKGANRRFIQYGDQKGGEKLLPGLAVIGMNSSGRPKTWTTRYRIREGTWVSFKIRLPNLVGRQSSLRVRINSEKGKGYETNFFNDIGLVSGNRVTKKVVTPLEAFTGPPPDWFPRRGEPIDVEFGIRDGKCTVIFDGREMVSVPVKSDRGGRVAFIFSRLVFTLQDLKITGVIDEESLKEDLERLEKEGELSLE